MASASSLPSKDEKQYLKSLLECSICLETFDNPRTLSCLHSFCKECLEDFVNGKSENELNCPVCRTKFTVNKDGVAAMTRNHFICNMVEVMSIQHQDKCIPCAHCEQASVGRCVTCEQFMCERCFKPHNEFRGFQDHVVLSLQELSKPENRSKIRGKSYCKKHPSKQLKLFCESCEKLICSYCMAFEHVRPDHVCSPLEDIAGRKRSELKTICTALESKENNTQVYYDELSFTSFDIEEKLKRVKKSTLQMKDRILRLVKDSLDTKARSFIEETEKVARVKMQTIDEELKRVLDHKAAQRKTYDTAQALVDNGSNEEIMLSYKLVQESVKNDEENEIDVDDDLPGHSDNELAGMLLDEIKAIERDQLSGMFDPQTRKWSTEEVELVQDLKTGKLTFRDEQLGVKTTFDPRTNKTTACVKDGNFAICHKTGKLTYKNEQNVKCVFDPQTGKSTYIGEHGVVVHDQHTGEMTIKNEQGDELVSVSETGELIVKNEGY